jgi:type I restriction enzyme M protein
LRDFADLRQGILDSLPPDTSEAAAARLAMPLLLMCRLDGALKATKDKVLAAERNLGPSVAEGKKAVFLYKAAGVPYYNTSPLNFSGALESVAAFKEYVGSFSDTVKEVLVGLDFYKLLVTKETADLLKPLAEYIAALDLDSFDMGDLWQNMAKAAYAEILDNEDSAKKDLAAAIYLRLAAAKGQASDKERVLYSPFVGDAVLFSRVKSELSEVFGKNLKIGVQVEDSLSRALLWGELLLTGEHGINIKGGSVLREDKLKMAADFVWADLTQAKGWQDEEEAVRRDHQSIGFKGRFGAGLPDIGDSQMLYMQQIILTMKKFEHGGARAAFITDARPLMHGTAGSGESEIRSWLIRAGIVTAIIKLGGASYGREYFLWYCDTRKNAAMHSDIQLIDAELVDGRNNAEIADAIANVITWHEESDFCRLKGSGDFAYDEVTIVSPLQQNYAVNQARLQRVVANGHIAGILDDFEQMELLQSLLAIGGKIYRSRGVFQKKVAAALGNMERALPPEVEDLIVDLLAEHDEGDRKLGIADGDWQDKEKIYLSEDKDEYFAKYIEPFVPNGAIDTEKTKRGWDIPFEMVFPTAKRRQSCRELADKIKRLEKKLHAEIGELL